MRIVGRRADGAYHLSIGSGFSLILRGKRVTAPTDCTVVDKMGPWNPLPGGAALQLSLRRQVEDVLKKARVVSLDTINLDMSFDEQRDRVWQALRLRLGLPVTGYNSMYPGGSDMYIPQNGLGLDWVVYCQNGKHYAMVYSIGGDGTVNFDGNPDEVAPSWEYVNARAEQEADEAYKGIGVEQGGDVPPEAEAEQYHGLKQTPWFKKFMASKKKLAGTKEAKTT